MAIEAVTLANLEASRTGPRVRVGKLEARAVHLRQGDLDAACGQHCVLMALIIIGAFNRAQFVRAVLRPRSSIGRVWCRLRELYFEGSIAQELEEALAPVADTVRTRRCEGSGAVVSRFAVRQVSCGRPVVLELHGPAIDHFVLVVGYERWAANGRRVPTSLLAIDPSKTAATTAVWNTRIDLRGRSHLRRVTAIDGSTRMAAMCAAMAVWTTQAKG